MNWFAANVMWGTNAILFTIFEGWFFLLKRRKPWSWYKFFFKKNGGRDPSWCCIFDSSNNLRTRRLLAVKNSHVSVQSSQHTRMINVLKTSLSFKKSLVICNYQLRQRQGCQSKTCKKFNYHSQIRLDKLVDRQETFTSFGMSVT